MGDYAFSTLDTTYDGNDYDRPLVASDDELKVRFNKNVQSNRSGSLSLASTTPLATSTDTSRRASTGLTGFFKRVDSKEKLEEVDDNNNSDSDSNRSNPIRARSTSKGNVKLFMTTESTNAHDGDNGQNNIVKNKRKKSLVNLHKAKTTAT
eukprot:Pgem_evm1s4664